MKISLTAFALATMLLGANAQAKNNECVPLWSARVRTPTSTFIAYVHAKYQSDARAALEAQHGQGNVWGLLQKKRCP